MSKPPNSQRRSQRSRRATLDAALELSVEKGYGNVTMDAITTRAGVSKATVYRWWPSKGAVMLEAVNDAATVTMGFPDTGDITGDLRTQLAALVRLLTEAETGSALTGLLAEALHDPD
ncbi:MAG: TetR/AcrR family transcriptional regulator, partial [Stackebrandtia sp.]